MLSGHETRRGSANAAGAAFGLVGIGFCVSAILSAPAGERLGPILSALIAGIAGSVIGVITTIHMSRSPSKPGRFRNTALVVGAVVLGNSLISGQTPGLQAAVLAFSAGLLLATATLFRPYSRPHQDMSG